MELFEDSLVASDLEDLVSHIFEIDSYKSKMGSDKDIVVLSFKVETKDAAADLVSFIEKGYKSVLDADLTPGELANGKYLVFVELTRNRKVISNIVELLYGIGKLASIDEFKFRYYKSFTSTIATESNLQAAVPVTPVDYVSFMSDTQLENFQNFFKNTFLERIDLTDDNVLVFNRIYAEPIRMKIINSGPATQLINTITESVSLDYRDMSEVLFLTKYIGNFNITKYADKFMFENRKYSVILKRV